MNTGIRIFLVLFVLFRFLFANPSDTETLIVPLYSYPYGDYVKEWNKLASFYSDKEVIVIVNYSSGPGNQKDTYYEGFLSLLKNTGKKLVGYVYTEYGNRDISVVKSEIDRWFQFYGEYIKGIFLDQVSTTNMAYYRELHKYIKEHYPCAEIILNPGTNISPLFFTIADRIVVAEMGANTYENYAYNDYSVVEAKRVCSIIHTVPSLDKVLEFKQKALENNSSCLYFTETPANYFVISSYLGEF